MAKYRQPRGFSVVEGVIIVALVCAVAGLAWWGYQGKQKSAVVTKTDTATKTAPLAKPADISANWFLYLSPGNEFSIKIPDGWKLSRYLKNPSIYADNLQSITYLKGVAGSVTEVPGGRDFAAVAYMLSFGRASEVQAPDGVKQSSFTTSAGATVDKYYNVVTVEPEGPTPPKGTKQYEYKIVVGNNVVFVRHDVVPGEADQTGLVEASIKTLTF